MAIASGVCGTCQWEILDNGKLLVWYGELGLVAGHSWPWLEYASDITSVDMSASISAGPSCDEMFKDCVNLVEADLSGLDVSSSSSAMMMFYGCSSLERLDVSSWNVGRMVTVAGMFLECGTNDLVLDLSSWDTSGIANTSALFTTYGDPDATAYLGNRSFTGGRIVTGAGWTLETALPPQNYGTGDTYTWHDTTGWRTAISECYRCDSSGNAKPDGGEYVKAGATWSIGTTGSAITQTSSGKHDYIRDDVMSGLSMTGTVEILDPSTSSIFTGTLVASGTPAIIAASTNELEVTISLTDGSVTVEHYATVPSGTPPVLSAHKSGGMVDGLGLGASYKEGYVNNGFPHAILGQPVPPTFYYATKPTESDLPITPCIVIQTSDWSVWYCDNESTPAYHQLADNTKVSKSGDAMTGQLALNGSDILLKTYGSSSNDSGDIVWYYGNGQEKSRIWTKDTYTSSAGPNYRVYKEDGTLLYNGTIACMIAGIICPFGGSSAPYGFLMCNGQAVSRTTYAALFAVIGTTYGGGNGSTTFNVPDLRGRTVIGSNSSHALGSTGGAETVKLTQNQSALPSHGHGFTQPTVNGGATTTSEKSLTGWTALYSDTGMFNPGSGYRSGIITEGGRRSTSYRPAWTGGTSYDMNINASHSHPQVAHTHSVTGGAVSKNNGWDASQAHNNMQPFATINYIISTGG